MPSWNEVLEELKTSMRVDAIDHVRRKYLKQLADYRGRNVIGYYSGWLQKPNASACSINDDDKNALMAVIHGLDRSKGLDILLHTPGGDMAATESIIDYLHRMFDGDINAIIPQIAMSGGTMIACSCSKIIMGKQSNLGPIDPQFGGMPAHGVIEEFETAVRETREDPSRIPMWQPIIGKYHPTFIGECRKAIQLAGDVVSSRLQSTMFKAIKKDDERASCARKVVEFLNEHKDSKTHARHIHIDEAKGCGLIIENLEDDQTFQDLTLTTHHCFMHTFAQTGAIKIVENNIGNTVAIMQQAR